MKRFIGAVAALAALTLTAAAVQAQPVLVVALRSYQDTNEDIVYLGKELNYEFLPIAVSKLADKLLQTTGIKIDGLDAIAPNQPLGLAVMADGDAVAPVAVFPTAEPDKLLDQLKPIVGAAKKGENGVYELEKQTLGAFAKASEGWLALAPTPDQLEHIADAAKALGDAVGNRDFTVQLNVQNIPEGTRGLLIDQLRIALEDANEKKPEETEAFHAFRLEVGRLRSQLVGRALAESEQITLGVTINREDKDRPGRFELHIKPLADSQIARHFAELKDLKSRFGGVLSGDDKGSGLVMNMTGPLDKDSIADYAKQIDTYREATIDLIGRADQPRNDEERAILKDLATAFTDLVKSTIEAGQLDVAIRLNERPKRGAVFAIRVAQPEDLKKFVDRIGELSQGDPGFAAVALNAAEHQGSAIHSFTFKPEKDSQFDKLAKNIADKPVLYVATKDDNLYLALGTSGVDLIKQAIDGSETPVQPLTAQMQLRTMMRTASQLVDQQQLQMVFSVLMTPLQGADKATVTASVADDGTLQVVGETEKGLVKLFGTVFGQLGPMVLDVLSGKGPNLGAGT